MIDSATIRKTFCDEAIRTVMLIDDEFPTYSDLQHDIEEKGPEDSTPAADQSQVGPMGTTPPKRKWEFARAKALYDAFKGRTLLCDIENDPNKLTHPHIERVRKSDLIVLDYNLKGNDDAADSIGLLGTLADSSHFNLVVVYTKEKLDLVWMKVAASLHAGWTHAKDMLAEDEDTDEIRRDFLAKQRTEYKIAESVIADYILLGRKAFSGPAAQTLKSDLKEAEVPYSKFPVIMEALANEQILATLQVGIGGDPRLVSGSYKADGVRWIHCGTVFITFMHKELEAEADAAKMYDLLVDALVDWSPNVLQVFLSQIQNILELKALAYDKRVFESEALQAGWLYHALTELWERKADRTDAIRHVVERLYARVLDTIGSNLMYDYNACDEGIKMFEKYLSDKQPKEDFGERVQQAVDLCGMARKPNDGEVLHALNSYLSTEIFRGDHITNGTIFFEADADGKGDWWACTSPACDMVPRPLKDGFNLYHSLAPFIPMTALRLESTSSESLKTATQGRVIFVSHEGKQRYFHAFNSVTHQPRSAYFMLGATAAVQDAKFEALALAIEDGKVSLTPRKFQIAAQLRSDYASRLLQQVGHHNSRIGVDFVDHIVKEDSARGDKSKKG